METREIFYFDYGVVMLWGFSENEEQMALDSISSFLIGKLSDDEIEIEQLNYSIDPDGPSRLFNDMINLKSNNHLLKLTISHAVAQSVKLSYFEEEIEEAIHDTKHIPINLAQSGSVNMRKSTVNKLIGRLFTMRINVNLVSNVLDTPEIFWYKSEMTPLYKSVRAYLEISQRVTVLNDRTNVITDMLNILKDHLNNSHGITLEYIMIILVIIEVCMGVTNICLKFI